MSVDSWTNRIMSQYGELGLLDRDVILPHLIGRLEMAFELSKRNHVCVKYALEQIEKSIEAAITYGAAKPQTDGVGQ